MTPNSRIRFRAVALLVIVVAVFALARSGLLEQGPIICPLRATTGLPCGSCGLTRGVCAVTRGEFANAQRLNLLSLPLAGMAACALALLGVEACLGRPALRPAWSRGSTIVTWAGVALLLVQWGVNLAASPAAASRTTKAVQVHAD